MPKTPTAQDAQLIMQLYDLRREEEMRKARAWFAGWWPNTAEEILKVVLGHGSVLCVARGIERGPLRR
jgi:hypothetical protein